MGFIRTKELTFIMTNRCNLNCIYCYPGDYRYGNMSINLDFAKRGIIDFLVKERLGPIDKIRFFGIGEPTFEFNLMKKIYEFVKEEVVINKRKPIKSEIQTNGVFSEEIAEWLGHNLNVIAISYDGLPHIQNKQRPFIDGRPTSEIIERNVKILKKYNSTDIGMRPTITKESNNVKTMKEIIDFAQNTGFDYIYFHPMIPRQGPNISRKDDIPYAIDPIDFVKNYVEAWEYSLSKKIFLGNHFTINFDEESDYYCRSCLPCPQLTLDNYVSVCDEALYGSHELGNGRFDKLMIGRYDIQNDKIELNEDKIQNIRIRRNVNNMDICKDCALAKNCGGGCVGEALFSTGDPFKKLSSSYCDAIKYLAKYIPRNQGLYRYMHP